MRLSDLNGEFFVSLDSQRLETANRRLQKWSLPYLRQPSAFSLRYVALKCNVEAEERSRLMEMVIAVPRDADNNLTNLYTGYDFSAGKAALV